MSVRYNKVEIEWELVIYPLLPTRVLWNPLLWIFILSLCSSTVSVLAERLQTCGICMPNCEILDTSGGIFSQPTQICFLIRLNGILCFPLNMISPQSDLEGSLAGIGVEELETSSGVAGP